MDHTGGVAEGEEGGDGVRAAPAEGDPAAEPHPARGAACAELDAQRVPQGPLHPLQPRLRRGNLSCGRR